MGHHSFAIYRNSSIQISKYIPFAIWPVRFSNARPANSWARLKVIVNALAAVIHQHHLRRARYATPILLFVSPVWTDAYSEHLIVNLVFPAPQAFPIYLDCRFLANAFSLRFVKNGIGTAFYALVQDGDKTWFAHAATNLIDDLLFFIGPAGWVV